MIAQILKKFRIKQKLVVINLFTTGATLLLAGIVLLLNEFASTRNALVYNLTSLAEILADNSMAPLVFNDQKTAGETLRALRASPNIERAIVYDKEGRVFADYRRADVPQKPLPAAPAGKGHSFVDNHLDIFRSIQLDGEMIGSIHIRSDLEILYSMMIKDGAIAAVTMAAVFAMAFILLLRLQKVITEPISDLEQMMRTISRDRDYSLKANVAGKDEIASLAKGFNEMLEQIRERDVQLQIEIAERKHVQEELVRKEKLALLGLIAGGMGNELRNPLGVMNNAVFYLQSVMPDADETVREYLEIIRNEIGNSEQIINDLLDFYHIKTPRIQPTPVNELVEQSLMKCAIPENIQLRTDIQALSALVLIDRKQMEKVVQNLVVNAVQAMPNGGALWISARQVRGTGNGERGTLEPRTPIPDPGFVEISIADTGEGIAPENMARLFQPLFTTKSRGIGLGLALTKKFTEANGGRIKVESTLGKGTTFTVILPIQGGAWVKN